jgi:hypothetical protein
MAVSLKPWPKGAEAYVADCEDDEAGRLAKAFLETREMEQMHSYLERGRPWQHLPVGELEQRWRTAGEAFIGNDDQSRVRPFQDFDAEYKLRDLIRRTSCSSPLSTRQWSA